MRFLEMQLGHLKFRWDDNAYGSIIWTILGTAPDLPAGAAAEFFIMAALDHPPLAGPQARPGCDPGRRLLVLGGGDVGRCVTRRSISGHACCMKWTVTRDDIDTLNTDRSRRRGRSVALWARRARCAAAIWAHPAAKSATRWSPWVCNRPQLASCCT